MADTNWIKLNRKIWDNFIWDFNKPQYALAWVDMLLMANYMDKKIMFNGKVETVPRGSFISSMLKLAERWKMNRKTVKSFLDVLQQSGMITYTATKKRTTVSITNYSTYQGFAGFDAEDDGQHDGQPTGQPSGQHDGQPTGQPSGQHDGQPTGQPSGHNIRILKNVEEGEEGKKGEETPPATVPPPSPPVPYEEIKDLYNTFCPSFPRCTVLSDERKKALKARFRRGYTLETFETLFQKAEASSFLKGGNNRNWRASFDWLIKEANMAKVLDGNYDDSNRQGTHRYNRSESDWETGNPFMEMLQEERGGGYR